MHQELNISGMWQCMPDPDNIIETSINNYVVYKANEQPWHDIVVPAHWQQAGFADHQGVMWYRRLFTVPARQDDISYYVHFGGVDYFAEVWLNGHYLGAHEGDFDAFSFRVTDALRFGSENELIVKVTAALDANPERKAIAKGGLYHWDCLPVRQQGLADCPEVPSAANEQYPNPLVNPGGIWRDVVLQLRPIVHLTDVRVTPYLAEDYQSARVYVDMRWNNDSRQDVDYALAVRMVPHNFVGDTAVTACDELFVPPGAGSRMMRLVMPNPILWWSRGLGEPNLYRAIVELTCGTTVIETKEITFGIRDIRIEADWGVYVNGKRLFIKGNNYLSDQFLSLMDEVKYKRDVQMMLDAHMNMTRLFAHAEKEEFYRLCDEKGLLIFQDLPFQWGYRSDGEFINRAADISRRFVERLAHHPSIALWCCHSESRMHDYNKLDAVLMETVRKADPTRPVHKNSVLIDQGELPPFFATWDDFAAYVPEHLSVNWVGWYWGKIEDAEQYNPLFVTEYGTQSLPDVASLRKFLAPDELWPPDMNAWRKRGFQNVICEKRTGELPDSLEELIEQTQNYQVAFYKAHTEALRRRKYNKVNGILQFHFVNTWPAIDWAIIDYYRQPKKAYHAIQKAFAPLLLSFTGNVERVDDTVQVTMEAWVVNDEYREYEGLEIAYRLLDMDGAVLEERIVLAPLIGEDSVRCFDRAVLTLPASGEVYRLEGVLRDRDGCVMAHNDCVLHLHGKAEEIETAADVKAGL